MRAFPVIRRSAATSIGLSSVLALAGQATPAVTSGAMQLTASVTGTVGKYSFADAKTGTNRVRCGFSSSGGLTSVVAPPPKAQPVPGWAPANAGQWVRWTAYLQKRKGSSWLTVAHRTTKKFAPYGSWTTMPRLSAFGTGVISAPHGTYRVREKMFWYRPNVNTVQGTVTKTMAHYHYPYTTAAHSDCRNLAPKSTMGSSITTYPGDTYAHQFTETDADSDSPLYANHFVATLNGTTVSGFTSVSANHFVTFHATEAQVNHTLTLKYRMHDPAGASSPIYTIYVKVVPPPGSTNPTAPRIGVSHPSATQVAFNWGVATPHGCSVVGYVYSVNGGGWVGTHENSGVTLGSGYSQTYSITVQVKDACGRYGQSGASASTNPPPPAVSIYKGAHVSTSSCSSSSCAYVDVSASHFAPNTTYTVNWYCDSGSGCSPMYSHAFTTDGNGNLNTGDGYAYYGYPGTHVWVVINGVQSNTITW